MPRDFARFLLNLAGNAIKFTETGGVLVTAELAASRAGPDTIALRVEDSGIGIGAEDQARIFEEFEQAEGGFNRRFSGTGLGLAITERLVEAMGGEIAVQSSPGHGAAFTCTLPLPVVPDADIADDEAAVPPRLAGAAVLIAAPGAIEASQLGRRLRAWGAQARIVATPTEAREALPTRQWDSVIVDAAFGGGEAERIGAAIAASVRRKLVLVTPADRAALALFTAAGFTGYLVKPVRTASLARRFAGPANATTQATAAPPEAQARPPSNVAQGVAPAAAKPPGLAVLVAEDNDINALLAGNLLRRLGHRPVIAATGAEALACFEAAQASGKPFDVVLMDLRMPGIDGIEATRRIRAGARQHGAPHIPIIALTADTAAENCDACMAAGMDGFLTKPLDRARLASALDRVRLRGPGGVSPRRLAHQNAAIMRPSGRSFMLGKHSACARLEPHDRRDTE